jgi:hypothetical protein
MASQWFVEPSVAEPRLLVQVDGFEAKVMSGKRPTWVRRNSMISWSWDSTGINVTRGQAEKIAASWGGQL